MEVIDLIRDEFKEARKQNRQDLKDISKKVEALERKMYLVMSVGSVTITLIMNYLRGVLK